jgi:hypothetical protein
MLKTWILLSLFAILLNINCSYHPFVPPGEIISISSPATLNQNQFAVSGAWGSSFALFIYNIDNSWVKMSYGLTNSVELSLSTSGVFYDDTQKTYVNYKRYSLGGYVSSKVAIIPNTLSMTGGIGVGFSDLGNYANFDVGIIQGWENRFVVPIDQMNLFIGLPFNPQNHDLSLRSGDSLQNMFKPELTTGFKISVGAKFPISLWFGFKDKFSIYLVNGYSIIWDAQQNNQFLSFGSGVQYKF